MMRIGLSLSPARSRFAPLLFAGDLEKGLAAASRLGYDGVELSLLDSARVDRAALTAMLGDLNLAVFTIATGQTAVTDGCSLFGADAGRRLRAVDRMKGHIDLAAELGSMVIIGGIRGRIDAPDETAAAVMAAHGREAVAACVEHARRCGVTLLLEPINRYETNVVNTLREGADLAAALGEGSVKLLPDTFHMNIEEASMEGSIAACAGRVGFVHLADSNRLAPGWGHTDFTGILRAMRGIDYQGPVGIEVLPLPDDYAAAEQAIRCVRGLTEQGQAPLREGAR